MNEYTKAVDVVRKVIKKDKEMKYVYQCSIAMCYIDNYNRWKAKNRFKRPSQDDLHEIANSAAIEFLDLFTANKG